MTINCDRCSLERAVPDSVIGSACFKVHICHPKLFHSTTPAADLRNPAYNLRRTRFTEWKCLHISASILNRRFRHLCLTTASGGARIQCPPFNFTEPECGAKPYKRTPLLSKQACPSPIDAGHISQVHHHRPWLTSTASVLMVMFTPVFLR